MALTNKFITESLGAVTKRLVESGGVTDAKKLAAVQRFNENLIRLEWRHKELWAIESQLFRLSGAGDLDSQTIQLSFVDKTEAYYQQLYATISSFIMVLNNVLSHEERKSLKISGAKAFLESLALKYPEISEDIRNLEAARAFRAKFIDHIQQHILHDWCTVSNVVGKGAPGCTLIFFVRKNSEHEAVFRTTFDPYAPGYEPPVNYSSFFVSPLYREIQGSFQRVVLHVLSDASDRKSED